VQELKEQARPSAATRSCTDSHLPHFLRRVNTRLLPFHTFVFCFAFTLVFLFEIFLCFSLQLTLITSSIPLRLRPDPSTVMTAIPPANGAVVPATTVAGPPVPSGPGATPKKKHVRIKPVKSRECCFNEPGGPWPRYYHTSLDAPLPSLTGIQQHHASGCHLSRYQEEADDSRRWPRGGSLHLVP
jgi:hypothetical protein